MQRILKATQLRKIYGRQSNLFMALDNISLSIEQGEFVGIMGPSGAGKTTLLNMLSTIDQPTAGNIWIKGHEITDMSDNQLADFRRHHLGFIFQDFNLIDALSVKENILLPLALDKVERDVMMRRLKAVGAILGIDAIMERYPDEISVGQKQRVASARAIIDQPDIIFADEPTGSLDSKSATELLQYLTEINLQEDTTIVMVTHDAFTASYCNRILFIKDGQVFSEIVRHQSRQDFFQKIIDMQSTIGGGVSHRVN